MHTGIFKDKVDVKLQPQSGLGDLIFALPLIERLAHEGHRVTVATNHGYALAPYGVAVAVVPVELKHGLPVVRPDAHHLRYNRYGAHYFKSYYEAFYPSESLIEFVEMARKRFREYAVKPIVVALPHEDYYVLAPPRAAHRHKRLKPPAQLECAPDVRSTWDTLPTHLQAVSVGQNEVYAPPPLLSGTFDLTDKLSFFELTQVIANA